MASKTNRDIDFWIRLENKSIKVFMTNGFCWRGKLTAICNEFFEILDFKSNTKKILRLNDVCDVEVLG